MAVRRKDYPGELNSWKCMLRRCFTPYDPSYKYVAGRGLSCCDRWLSFDNFLADMGPKPTPDHSIDRIDNDRGYSPDNCRWATRSEQQINSRKAVFIEFGGERLCISEWSRRTGIPAVTISNRRMRGWDAERILTVLPHGYRLVKPTQPIVRAIWHKPRQKWQGLVRAGGKTIYCGHRDSKEAAIAAASNKLNEMRVAGSAPATPTVSR